MENSTSIFKFVTVRNGVYEPSENPDVLIQPPTDLVTELIAINENEEFSTEEKFEAMNEQLADFIASPAFIRTQAAFNTMKAAQDADPLAAHVDDLYNNIIVRVMTKSNTSRIFQQLIVQLKSIFAQVYEQEIPELSVVIPERLILSFTGFHSTQEPIEEETQDEVLRPFHDAIIKYSNLQRLVEKARRENVVSFPAITKIKVQNTKYALVNEVLETNAISVADAKTKVTVQLNDLENLFERKYQGRHGQKSGPVHGQEEVPEEDVINVTSEREKYERVQKLINEASAAGLQIFERETVKDAGVFAPINIELKVEGITIDEATDRINATLAKAYEALIDNIRPDSYVRIADKWVDLARFKNEPESATVEDDAIVVYSNGCYLRFPFFVADLRVIEQMAVGYLPAEIAHINNTQPGEQHEKETRRLKRVESVESLISESEVFHETDTQSAEKFSMEREGYEVEASENSLNVSASASAGFGPFSGSIDASYGTSESSVNSNTFSQSYAKDIFQRVVDRVSNKIRSERTLKTLEEFEERVKHVIDNRGQATKSYVYRWLNKLVRGKLKNYGKRLMFQIDVAHPSHYYLSRTISEQPKLNIPPDPREIEVMGVKVFSPQQITRENYLAWSNMYDARLEQPPVKTIRVSDNFSGASNTITGKQLPIKQGYACRRAFVSNSYAIGGTPPSGHQIRVIVGNSGFAYFNHESDLYSPRELWLAGETEQLPVTVWQGPASFILTLEVECELTPEAFEAWQLKCYHAIIDAYEHLKTEAESKMTAWDPNLPGLNPSKKLELIRTELKKEAIRKMHRCNPFWIKDNYEVGKEYDPSCCAETQNAEKIRFLESVFDWNNMSYELHPYFYADKDNWAKLLNLSDDDPHFEAFLQASYATVRIPVFRDALKERAAVNFIMNNSIANYETIPENMQAQLEELKGAPSLFTVDLEGNEIPEPTSTIDLGVFPIPTNLVILECGVSDGVKPIGFPQSDTPPTSDVLIPKQYSPAIIADSCSTPPSDPGEGGEGEGGEG